ncbi:MAG: hypothetical protein ABSA69_08580 [Verrucomicrobiota bacterium]|jgi:hypothetical protein
MPKEKNKLSFEAIAAQLALMGRKLDQAQKLFDRLDGLLDAVACDLRELIGHLIVFPLGSTKVSSPVGGMPRRLLPLHCKSNPGVVSVLLIRNSDGSADAQIEGHSPIPLSPLLTTLLEILKADKGISDDHLVGWKSMASIQLALKESTGRNHSEASIKELIYNLRNCLECHREDRSLVENKPRFGYRFAVRRAAGTTTERDNH